MLPPVYSTLRANAALVALVGTKIGRHGSIPQDTVPPYITWQLIIGQPYDQLSGPPCGDFDSVQIDCYAGPADSADAQIEAIAIAVRDALDAAGIANRTSIDLRERDTKLYRISIDADFISSR